jgi:cytochrome c peroxidase
MKKSFFILALFISVAILHSCNKSSEDTLTTTAYLDLPAVPYEYFTDSTSNFASKDSLNHIATLGRVLFYDSHLSLNNSISCGSCHKQDIGFADNKPFSRGYEGKLTGRNTPGIHGLTSFRPLFWDGRERVLQDLITRPVSNHVEMGISDLNTLPPKLAALSYYKQLFTAAYNSEEVTLDKISNALTCFLQTIGPATNFKMFFSANTSELSPLQLEGKNLFDRTYNCGSCHMSGNGGYGGVGFFDIGLDDTYADKGMGAITGKTQEIGMFKAPDLTNVALTAPYMHDGRYNTLEEVLEHYSHGIANTPNLSMLLRTPSADGIVRPTNDPLRMNIKDNDKRAIIAFLGTLTDHRTNTDVKYSNPFKAR